MECEVVEQDTKKAVGLSDGGRVLLSCRNCDSKLVEVWQVDKNAKNRDGTPLTWLVQATCYACDNRSFEHEVTGRIQQAPYGDPNPNDPDDSILHCYIVDFRYEPNNKIVYVTNKAN